MVEQADGFEWFELLRPVEGTDNYLVYTRWRSEKDFEAWQASNAFGAGHGGATQGRPAAAGSTLWSFEVAQSAGPKPAAPQTARDEAGSNPG
jgi:heme-degrading monooxygenase HmoA